MTESPPSRQHQAFERSRTFQVLSGLLAALVAVAVYAAGRYGQGALAEDLAQEAATLHAAFTGVLADTEHHLLLSASLVAEDPEVRRQLTAAREGDGAAARRAALAGHVGALWETAHRDYGLRHLHFYLGPGVVSFLRMHRPGHFGDPLGELRPLVSDVVADGLSRAGLETGRHGTALRAAVAVRAPGDDTRVVGAVDAGLPLDHLVSRFRDATGSNVTVLLHRAHVEAAEGRPDGPAPGWREACDCVVEATPAPPPAAVLALVPRRPQALYQDRGTLVAAAGRHYHAAFYPLRDYQGTRAPGVPEVGAVALWREVTAAVAAQGARQQGLVFLGVVAFAVLELLLYGALRVNARLARAALDERTARLRDTETRYRTLVEELPDGVFLVDPETLGVTDFNDAAAHNLGYSRGEFARLSIVDLDADATEARQRERVAGIRARGRADFEARVATRSGDLRDVLVTVKWVELGGRGLLFSLVRDITDLKRAQQRLAASETRYRTLVETSPFSIQEIDTEANIRYANPASAAILGYPQDRLVTMNVADLLPPEDRDGFRALVRELAERQPPPEPVENVNLRGDGRRIHVRVNWSYLRDGDGALTGFMSVAEDITEARRAQVLLDGRKQVLELLVRGRPLPQVLTAVSDYLQRLDPALACSILLLDPAREVLQAVAATGLPDYLTAAIDGLAVGPGTGPWGATLQGAQRLVVADLLGHPDWALLRDLVARGPLRACWSEPVVGREGRTLGVLAVYSPEPRAPTPEEWGLLQSAAELVAVVVDHDRATQRVVRAEERARLLLESSNEGIFGIDAEGHTTFINPAAARMLGYPPEQLVGRNNHELVHHTLEDGTPIPPDRCRMLKVLQDGVDRVVSDECLWRSDGSPFPVEYRATPIRRGGPIEGAVITFHDISERRRAEAEIQHLAFHDPLTGLPNRLLFREKLGELVAGQQRSGRPFALHMLDLDHFKEVNDSLGHPVGDQLLEAVARRIRAVVRSGDFLARLGGDEFALVQTDLEDIGDSSTLAAKVIGAVSRPFELAENVVYTNASIGILVSDNPALTVDDLMSRADVALYKAKDAGRGVFAFFEDTMTLQLQREMTLTRELQQALERGEFVVEYQPQFALADGRLVGAEALVRWRHPERGVLAPGDFLEVAEKRGLIRPIGDWVLKEVCRQGAQWRARGLDFGRLAVNLCAAQVNDDDLAALVRGSLEEAGCAPELLELEYTETVLLKATDATRTAIRELSTLGVSFAIDDFGTGFSSLMYLKQFHTDKIKIDREFVRDVLTDAGDGEIVKATIALGRALGVTTLAEGVEAEDQAGFLRRHGCDQVQGYLYGRPMSAESLERRLGGVR